MDADRFFKHDALLTNWLKSLSATSVFKDKNKLSPRYIPRVLPHREKQISLLNSFFEDALEKMPDVYLRPIQLIGGVGAGKTCTTIRFAESFEERARKKGIDLKHIYVNLKLQGGSRVILYRYLTECVAPEIYSASLSAEEMLWRLVKYLQNEKRYLLVSLDEIDYFLEHTKEHIIYDLTRIGELSPGAPCGIIGLIFTARNMKFHEHLEKAELSTLGRNYIEFPLYTSKQISDILEKRVEEAFQPSAVSSEVLEYISDVTAAPPICGDVRYALDLLLYSGNLADNYGDREVSPEHVRRVHGEVHHIITTEDILNLPEEEKVVLLGIARSLRVSKSPYISLKSIRESTAEVCEEYNVKMVADLEGFVQDLHDRGVIEIKSLKKIGISGVTAKELSEYLDNLIERIKNGLV